MRNERMKVLAMAHFLAAIGQMIWIVLFYHRYLKNDHSFSSVNNEQYYGMIAVIAVSGFFYLAGSVFALFLSIQSQKRLNYRNYVPVWILVQIAIFISIGVIGWMVGVIYKTKEDVDFILCFGISFALLTQCINLIIICCGGRLVEYGDGEEPLTHRPPPIFINEEKFKDNAN